MAFLKNFVVKSNNMTNIKFCGYQICKLISHQNHRRTRHSSIANAWERQRHACCVYVCVSFVHKARPPSITMLWKQVHYVLHWLWPYIITTVSQKYYRNVLAELSVRTEYKCKKSSELHCTATHIWRRNRNVDEPKTEQRRKKKTAIHRWFIDLSSFRSIPSIAY